MAYISSKEYSKTTTVASTLLRVLDECYGGGGWGEKKVVKDSVVFGEKSWNFNSMFRIGLMKEAFEPLREG